MPSSKQRHKQALGFRLPDSAFRPPADCSPFQNSRAHRPSEMAHLLANATASPARNEPLKLGPEPDAVVPAVAGLVLLSRALFHTLAVRFIGWRWRGWETCDSRPSATKHPLPRRCSRRSLPHCRLLERLRFFQTNRRRSNLPSVSFLGANIRRQ